MARTVVIGIQDFEKLITKPLYQCESREKLADFP